MTTARSAESADSLESEWDVIPTIEVEFTTELTYTETVTEIIEEEIVEKVLVDGDDDDYDIRTHPPSGDLVHYAANSNASISLSQGVHNSDDRTYKNGSTLFSPHPIPIPPTSPPPVPRPAIPTDTPEMLIALTESAWRELGFSRDAMDSPLGEFFKYYSVFPYVNSKGPARTWVRYYLYSPNCQKTHKMNHYCLELLIF